MSQSINLLYVVFGAAVLRYCSMNEEIDQETLNAPHINFIIMGFLDCFAGFLSAMGTSLQSLIPTHFDIDILC